MGEEVEVAEELRPILIPIATYRFFLATRAECPDALSLWLHLVFTSMTRGGNKYVWASNSYLQTGLGIGRDRVKKAKAFLVTHDLIEHIRPKTAEGRFAPKTIIWVKGYADPTGLKSSLVDHRTDYQAPENQALGFRHQSEEKEENIKSKNKPIAQHEYTLDFESFWQAYPRREGKRSAWRQWAARIKSGATANEMIAGAKAYAARTKRENRDLKFVKLPATFLGPDEHFREVTEAASQPAQTIEWAKPILFTEAAK